MSKDTEIAARSLLSPVMGRLNDRVVGRAEGAYLFDTEGNRFIDFTSGIGVNSIGHVHPAVVAAIREQAEDLVFVQINCMLSPRTLELAESLLPLMPEGINCFFFANSGAEANEGAIKLAKKATGRGGLISFHGSFHGRTHLTMALTNSKSGYRNGYQPLPAGIFSAPFPYAFALGMSEDEATDHCLAQLDLLFQQQVSPAEIAAIIVEPVLGEGGYVPAPDRFLQALRALCDEHGIFLIYDEIQTGFGRTGEWWGHTQSGAVPDVLVLAKGIASGMPLSVIASSRSAMEKWGVGTHGSTYGGGNAVVAAAAIATVRTIADDGLIDNAKRVGAHLMAELRSLQAKHAVIGDVRGRGLMIGTELVLDGKPVTELTTAVKAGCLERGLMLLSCGRGASTLRWIPPLIVTEAQIDEALTIFDEALKSVAS